MDALVYSIGATYICSCISAAIWKGLGGVFCTISCILTGNVFLLAAAKGVQMLLSFHTNWRANRGLWLIAPKRIRSI